MVKGLRGSQADNIDEHIDALHPGSGPATPSMSDVRDIQRKILEQKPKTGKNYQASPDEGTASLNPFKNWRNVGRAFGK